MKKIIKLLSAVLMLTVLSCTYLGLYKDIVPKAYAEENTDSWEGIYINGDREIIIVAVDTEGTSYVALVYEPASGQAIENQMWIDIRDTEISGDKIESIMSNPGYDATYYFTRSGENLTY